MPDASHCVQCGAPLPANWPKGLCSRCALQDALEIEGGESQVVEALQTSTLNAQPSTTSETSGTRIGRYKLLEQIGEGGFGAVWMAEQEESVRRRVALKIIKLGMDSKQVIARFEAERQALAMMDHPNIAKVLDAGATDTGRPYFVMELVRGIRITEYCDQNNLTTRARLDLFIRVCQAIQHAHQKGIIHRDIKPSNVLVTLHDSVPVPKVIDFGIAKATEGRLTDKTLFTSFQQFIGTPAYVSPEQAEMSGLDVDTRSDIYSLGVLLYQLLTGQTPFDTKELVNSGLDAIRRTLREVEPPRPSTRLSTLDDVTMTATAKQRQTEPPRLLHQIQGDLDWIVMKCLEKDRTRRYETANGLAMDIGRHLNNEPVVACPPSSLYRLQKLARRNKLAVAAGATIAMILVLGVLVSTWQAVRATRAEHEQKRLREAAQRAQANEAKLRQHEEQARLRAEASAQVSQLMTEMADLLIDQDRLAEAELRMRRAFTLTRDSNPDRKAAIGLAYLMLSKRAVSTEQYDLAERAARQVISLFQELVQEYPKSSVYPEHLGNAHWWLGEVLTALRRRGEAERAFGEAIRIFETAASDFPNVVFLQQQYAEASGRLAEVIENDGRLDAAETEYRHAIRLHEKASAEFPKETVFLGGLGSLRVRLFELLSARGRLTGAQAVLREAAERGSAWELNAFAWLFATCPDPILRNATNAVAFAERAVAATNRKDPDILDTLAAAYAEAGQFTKAITTQQEAIALLPNEQVKKDYVSRLTLYQTNSSYRDSGRRRIRMSRSGP